MALLRTGTKPCPTPDLAVQTRSPLSVISEPCHHGMARRQVADGGMASDMDGSCEYIE